MPAYLVTKVDTKEVDERGKHVTNKDRILKQCKVRADNLADVVIMRVTGAPSDLHASDARYTEVLQVIAKKATRTQTRHRSQ